MKQQMKKLFATAGLVAASVLVSQAQPYYLAGDWQTPTTWQAGVNQMTAGPNAGEYSYTITGGTPGAYANCKVTGSDGTWANNWPSDGNVTVLYDSTGSATIHFWPGSPGDGWLPFNNRIGYDDPNNGLGWGMAGAFDGWDGTQTILASLGNGVYSNSITVTTAASADNEFKFQSPAGSWSQIYFGNDFGNNGNNGVFTTTNSPQTLPVVLDLPNGRWLVGAAVPTPPTNYVTFQLDLSAQILAHNFTNGFPGNSVAVAADFLDWGTGHQLTNASILNPGDLRTNLYIGTFAWQTFLTPTPTSGWKFRVNSLDGGYEQPASTSGGNRTLTLTNANQVLSVLYYDDLKVSDLVQKDTLVTFSVYVPDGTAIYPTGTFTKGVDSVFVNGSWLGWIWGYESLPVEQQLFESATPNVYTNTLLIPAGTSLALTYKYSIDGVDNENGSGTNHIRYIRTYATNYSFPQDTWSLSLPNQGSPYPNPGIASTNLVEPSFGYLAVSALSAGKVPVTWLGRPGVILQGSSSLPGGIWNDYMATDGTQSTNWPATGSAQFFRLKKY
jgi:hypothetical protein